MPPGDSRFLALLGNPNVMSGSLDKGRQSVFAILDRLRRPSAPGTEAAAGAASSSTPGEENDDDREGDGSVMLYAPLVPGEDSEVELAASDITSVFDDGETLEYEQPARPLSFVQAGEQHTPRPSSRALPSEIPGRSAQDEGSADTSQSDTQKETGSAGWFGTFKEKVFVGGKLVSDKVAEGTKSLQGKAGEGRKIVQTKTRWVPSSDKISFQATWWGYRLYVFVPIFTCKNWIDLVIVQVSAPACSGCVEQQAPGRSEARCYHNHGSTVVARSCPDQTRTTSVPLWGFDRAAASAISWLRRRFHCLELGCNKVL